MKTKVKVSELSLSTISHATEDKNKVNKALLNVIPPELRNETELSEVILKGYYKNEIRIIKTVFRSKKAEEVFRYILRGLDDFSKGIIIATLSNRTDKKGSHMYLRLDKQMAYLGKLMLREGDDVIKITVTLKNVKSIDDIENYIKVISK